MPSGDSIVPPPASDVITPAALDDSVGVDTFVTRDRRLCQT